MPEQTSSATKLTKSALVAILAMFLLEEGRMRSPPSMPYLLLLLIGRRLLVLQVLLHVLLVLGNHVGHFGFLIGAQQLVNLRRDLGMLNLELHMSLRFLSSNCRGLSLVEVAAGHQLDQLLVRQEFLLHQRLDIGVFTLENLFDLRLLVIGNVQLVQGQPESVSSHKIAMHSVMHRHRFWALALRERHACTERERNREDC